MGHSRSLEMAPFDRSHLSFYASSVVNMFLSSIVTGILSVKYWRDLEIWVSIFRLYSIYDCWFAPFSSYLMLNRIIS